MYQAWRDGVAAGQEPTGADLARTPAAPTTHRRRSAGGPPLPASHATTGDNANGDSACTPTGYQLTSSTDDLMTTLTVGPLMRHLTRRLRPDRGSTTVEWSATSP